MKIPSMHSMIGFGSVTKRCELDRTAMRALRLQISFDCFCLYLSIVFLREHDYLVSKRGDDSKCVQGFFVGIMVFKSVCVWSPKEHECFLSFPWDCQLLPANRFIHFLMPTFIIFFAETREKPCKSTKSIIPCLVFFMLFLSELLLSEW